MLCYIFFFNDTATTEIYTLSLHDALPISRIAFSRLPMIVSASPLCAWVLAISFKRFRCDRSEEHTSELQSHLNLVCRLLLEKKNSTCAASLNVSKQATPKPPPKAQPQRTD